MSLDSAPAIDFTEYSQLENFRFGANVELFFIMNFLRFLRWKSKSEKTTAWESNDSNKTRMGFALTQDLFYFAFFEAAAKFRLGFGRC